MTVSEFQFVPSPPPGERSRRKRERIVGLVLAGFFVGLTFGEVHLLRISSRLPFVNSIFFFGLMNLNVVLIMALLFLVFRNVMKAIVEDRGGKSGKRLRMQLVFSFILFAIIPTVLLFAISAFYIRSSFDKWFSLRVGETLRQSLEVGHQFYDGAKRSGAHFARKTASELDASARVPEEATLEEMRRAYGLDGIEYYADPSSPRISAVHPERGASIPPAALETLQLAFRGALECRVQTLGDGDLVRCPARLGAGRGVLFTDTFVPVRLAESLAEIAMTWRDYDREGPLSPPIKSTYFSILVMVTLLILFAAVWTGFHLAKRLTGPLEALLRGTEAVTAGVLDYRIEPHGSYEFARLIRSFNQMTGELAHHKSAVESAYTELEGRNRYIETLLDSVQSGVLSLDEQGRIGMVNPAAARLLRANAEELLGKPYWAIVPEDHRAEARQMLAAVSDDRKPLRRELRIRVGAAEWRSILVTVSPLRDANGKRFGVVAVFDDVSDIRKMERLMAWQEVARRLAHEIKNPLTPIQLSVQRLQRRYAERLGGDEAFTQSTNIILQEVDALKQLVNEFSAYARLPQVRPQPEDLNAVVQEAVELFRNAHEGHEFRTLLASPPPRLALDRAAIKRVLMNLLDNAVAAMPTGGVIEIRTETTSDGSVRMVVADCGAGLSEEAASRLFEPYFSTKENGTGLGLAIVQRIVADHGAQVRAEARTPRGTSFIVDFPLPRRSGMEYAPGHRPPAPPLPELT